MGFLLGLAGKEGSVPTDGKIHRESRCLECSSLRTCVCQQAAQPDYQEAGQTCETHLDKVKFVLGNGIETSKPSVLPAWHTQE